MMTKRWKYILSSGHKGVYVTQELSKHIYEKFEKRQSNIVEEHELDVAWIEKGGACFIDRDIWSCNIDGLVIEIPISDCSTFIEQLSHNLLRPENNGDRDPNRSYRSIYGWMSVICLSQEQYETLLRRLQADIADITDRYEAETERWVAAMDALDEIQQNDPAVAKFISHRGQANAITTMQKIKLKVKNVEITDPNIDVTQMDSKTMVGFTNWVTSNPRSGFWS